MIDGTRVVLVMDRERTSCSPLSINSGTLLVRAKHGRKLGKELPKPFDKVCAEPMRQRLKIRVEQSSACNSARTQKAKDGREACDERVTLRWCAVDLPTLARKAEPVALVHVRKEEEPAAKRGSC